MIPYEHNFSFGAVVSEAEQEELKRLRKERELFVKLIDQLQEEPKASREGNEQLRQQIKELQEKLDILIFQMKKRNRKDFGDKTERHNPRPATEKKSFPTFRKRNQAKENKIEQGEKHILQQSLPTETIRHELPTEQCICPNCEIETVYVRDQITYQLEKISHTLKRLQHEQEVRACPKCKSYIVTADKPCPPIPGSYVGPGC